MCYSFFVYWAHVIWPPGELPLPSPLLAPLHLNYAPSLLAPLHLNYAPSRYKILKNNCIFTYCSAEMLSARGRRKNNCGSS